MQPGQIILFRFPQTDLDIGKLRPAVLLSKVPGPYEDWLICMISSQVRRYTTDFDELVEEDDSDFVTSGLKAPSVVRIGRLAVVDNSVLLGAIGTLSSERLARIKARLAKWLIEEPIR